MPRSTYIALSVGVFTVSIGYGFALPVLPFLVEHMVATGDNAVVARHAGLLTLQGLAGANSRRFPIEATNVKKGRDPHGPF